MRRGHAADTPPHVIGFVEGAAVTSAPANDDPRSGEPRDRPPRILAGRYELGAAVGGGGSAQVHRAWDRKLQRPVAVKLFAPGVSGPDRVRRGQELQTLARLTHPGLVELHDAGRDADRDFLVMQLVEGPSLADLVTRGPLPVPMVVGLGAALAEALAYVHAAGVTHRDLKPDNVLLDEQGRPLLADFGIALLVDGTRVTVAGDVVGTAAYLAPSRCGVRRWARPPTCTRSGWSCSRRCAASASTRGRPPRRSSPASTARRASPTTCPASSPPCCGR